MSEDKTYEWLMGGASPALVDAFDAHVLASIIALSALEAGGFNRLTSDSLGLTDAQFADVLSDVFPHVAAPLAPSRPAQLPHAADDETCLRELLFRFSSSGSALEQRLSAMMARRAIRPNHLWQDLGLRNRNELSTLMLRHFRPLATRNSSDMKWKKFLYRMICRDEGFRLCTAPCCADCDDFAACFGEESGESLLAGIRRQLGLERRPNGATPLVISLDT